MKDIFGSDDDVEESVEEPKKKSVANVEEEEEEEEEEIKLSKSMLTTIDGVKYYKTKAYGFDNFLFSSSGEAVGSYDEGTGLITEVMCDDSDEEDSEEE